MKTWPDWIAHHTTIFPGMRGDAGLATLSSWIAVFHRLGATPEAMIEASMELASSDVPTWPENHLRFLCGEVKEWIAQQSRGSGDYVAPEHPGCKLCCETGYASVPIASAIRGGIWGTAAVTCRCSLGLWKGQRRPQGQITLADYEQVYPNWRQVMIDHDEGLREFGAAQAISVSFGKAVGKLTASGRRNEPTEKLHLTHKRGLDE